MEKNFKEAADKKTPESEAGVGAPDAPGGESRGSGADGSGPTANDCTMEGLVGAGVDLGDVVDKPTADARKRVESALQRINQYSSIADVTMALEGTVLPSHKVQFAIQLAN